MCVCERERERGETFLGKNTTMGWNEDRLPKGVIRPVNSNNNNNSKIRQYGSNVCSQNQPRVVKVCSLASCNQVCEGRALSRE